MYSIYFWLVSEAIMSMTIVKCALNHCMVFVTCAGQSGIALFFH